MHAICRTTLWPGASVPEETLTASQEPPTGDGVPANDADAVLPDVGVPVPADPDVLDVGALT